MSTNVLCATCGTQFGPLWDGCKPPPVQECPICQDPRQYVPLSGQEWTTLALEKGKHRNIFQQDINDPRIWFIHTQPKLGIGNRCILLQTEHGNVLWDCLPFHDSTTFSLIRALGGIAAMVISHPHFYSTHLEWAAAFQCPVYTGSEDSEWLQLPDQHGCRRQLVDRHTSILPGVTAIKTGGHFPGSAVLHWERQLFIADSIVVNPSAFTPRPLPGTTTFSFLWSYPNQIPLRPSALHNIWLAVRDFEFANAFGGFVGQDLRTTTDLRPRLLESMKIIVRACGHEQHPLFAEATH